MNVQIALLDTVFTADALNPLVLNGTVGGEGADGVTAIKVGNTELPVVDGSFTASFGAVAEPKEIALTLVLVSEDEEVNGHEVDYTITIVASEEENTETPETDVAGGNLYEETSFPEVTEERTEDFGPTSTELITDNRADGIIDDYRMPVETDFGSDKATRNAQELGALYSPMESDEVRWPHRRMADDTHVEYFKAELPDAKDGRKGQTSGKDSLGGGFSSTGISV